MIITHCKITNVTCCRCGPQRSIGLCRHVHIMGTFLCKVWKLNSL